MDGYGAASQFGGGGFMPAGSQDGGGGAAASPKEKKYGNNQTLRAVTVKQLYDNTANTPDDQYRVDGVDLDNITLVGKIASVQEQSTNLTLMLDDGTGRVELKYWIDNDEAELLAQRKAEWKEGVYVRVHGHLRAFGGEKSIVAFNIRPVTDFNEVTYHGLQVVFQHLHITKGNAISPAEGAGAVPKPEAPSPMQNGFSATNGMNGGGGEGGFSTIQQAVTDALNTPDALAMADGVSLQELSGRLGGRYNITAIKGAADWLCNEGHAYTGADDSHYKSTSC
jgi:replication factor A2